MVGVCASQCLFSRRDSTDVTRAQNQRSSVLQSTRDDTCPCHPQLTIPEMADIYKDTKANHSTAYLMMIAKMIITE